ncbi:hypothetical protein [Haloferax profundi]|uniref:hypothetical protein n=1 Tax=Haloferax profundi TaxID=1544718 RepID=UPI0012F9EE9A|nr:hypothetical protein [Haloferax profundi]
MSRERRERSEQSNRLQISVRTLTAFAPDVLHARDARVELRQDVFLANTNLRETAVLHIAPDARFTIC